MVSICRFRSATRARDRGLHRGVILAAPPRRHSREPEPARLSVLTPSPYRRVLDGKPDLSEQHDNPATTGLPMTVRVSPRGAARHDVRIKVNVTHGNRMTIANTAIVAVGPVPRVCHRPALADRCAARLCLGDAKRECFGGILAGPGRHRSARAATAASLSNQRFAGQQRSTASGEHFFLVKESLSDGSADFLTVPGLVKSGLVG